jgi:hypothetical protein
VTRFASWLETPRRTTVAWASIVTYFRRRCEPSTITRFEMLLGAKELEMHHRRRS